jgi:hypothetical protein
MKRTFQDLMNFVCRVDTLKKSQIAEEYLKKLDYISNNEYNELMMALSYITRGLYRDRRYHN